MRPPSHRQLPPAAAARLALGIAFLAASGPAFILSGATACRADDAAPEFNFGTNSSLNRWSYGWRPSLTGSFTLYTAKSTDAFQLQYWKASPDDGSYVSYNPTATAKAIGGGTTIPPGGLNLQPGSAGQYAVVRWTAPVGGTYSISARFIARSTNSTARDVAVLRGTEVLFSLWILPAVHGTTASMSASLALAAGEALDFAVGPADPSNFSDVTGLDATVNWEPPAGPPAGPVLTFGDQRYLPARWPGQAFDEIAFDPVNRRLASQGKIRDLCGNVVSNGPENGQGLAWDPVTSTYWQVTGDRVVRRWNGATLLDTVFTAPLTFDVPGTGPDTLESVRGIALDSNYVYLADAGPDPGQIASNAWFKLTRAGTPVKSSRSTDLYQTLDADPDATFDDIVYSPHSSPTFPGRLLVALEHSGIQVLDTEGNYVDKFRWSQQALPPKDSARLYGKLTAFAGLALDPLTGNLYLENNDTGDAQAWTRLTRQWATPYAITCGGPQAWLQWPNPGCNLGLWHAFPSYAGNVFGIAYRPANRSVYACDFNSGELWRMDPRTGIGARVGPTGVESIWGMAYDPGRDRLLGGAETGAGIRIVSIDPATAAASPRPGNVGFYTTDLAFCTADSSLYGVANGPPPSRLIRIDRDTGVGTVVGNTVRVNGLDYEPLSGKLWGIRSGGLLFSIDPASGAAETLAVGPASGPWEGLAVVPVPANPVYLGTDAPNAPRAGRLRVWPNPARGPSRIAFDLAAPAGVSVRVFDVQGRAVRELQRTRLPAGEHAVTWDGADPAGHPSPGGVYFVRVETGGHSRVGRIVRVP